MQQFQALQQQQQLQQHLQHQVELVIEALVRIYADFFPRCIKVCRQRTRTRRRAIIVVTRSMTKTTVMTTMRITTIWIRMVTTKSSDHCCWFYVDRVLTAPRAETHPRKYLCYLIFVLLILMLPSIDSSLFLVSPSASSSIMYHSSMFMIRLIVFFFFFFFSCTCSYCDCMIYIDIKRKRNPTKELLRPHTHLACIYAPIFRPRCRFCIMTNNMFFFLLLFMSTLVHATMSDKQNFCSFSLSLSLFVYLVSKSRNRLVRSHQLKLRSQPACHIFRLRTEEMTTPLPTYPRIIIQPDWSLHLRENTLPVDVWLEFKAGSSHISRLTENVHGVCSIKAASDSEAKVYKTSAGDKFESSHIDGKKQQLRIKLQDTDFSHTFQGSKAFLFPRSQLDDDES